MGGGFQSLEIPRRRFSNPWKFRAAVLLMMPLVALQFSGCRPHSQSGSLSVLSQQPPVEAAATAALHPVVIRETAGRPQVRVGQAQDGTPVTVQCGTCHAIMAPDHTTRRSEDLDIFHQTLRFAHGQLACLSCHNKDDYDRLRLASDDQVEFPNVIQLCSQCHGPQWRDYQNGAHGGMNGYWDLTKGGRVRNNCTHCHDPHAPKYQPVIPAPGPADRFVGGHKGESHE